MKMSKGERWFCKEHGLEGKVGEDWCFGCYRWNDNTDSPVPHLGYDLNKKRGKV